MSNERTRRARDILNQFESQHRIGGVNSAAPSTLSAALLMHTDDGFMEVDHAIGGGRNRRFLMQPQPLPPPPPPPPPAVEVLRPQEMDQPADLSMKRESGGVSGGVDLSRASGMPGSTSSSSRHHSSSSRGNWNWWRRPETADEGALDLVSRPSRGPPEVKDENLGSSEVIVLSDEEGATVDTTNADATHKMNGHSNGAVSDEDDLLSLNRVADPTIALKEMSKEEVEQRQRLIMRLKEKLRREEMKLVLLKKLQLSHQLKDNLVVNSQSVPGANKSSSISNNLSSNSHNNSASRAAPGLMTDNLPPPLLRGQSSLLKSPAHQSTPHHNSSLARPHNAHGPPPLLSNHRGSSNHMSSSSSSHHAQMMHHQQSNNLMRGHSIMNRLPVTTPPNIVMGYQLPVTQSQVQMGSTISVTPSSHSVSHQQQQPPPPMEQPQRGDGQTPAQRQAAAKLALRKQLEKTLLQIPPPKPPPPELHFIPNPSNTEFIYLVGLESVVNFITEGDQPHDDEAPKPFNCIQCNTDFTPVWKWENTKTGTVICEQCVTSNIKKALKAEHTNRLKTAFVKALQQEQEIEQRMAQISSSPPSPTPLPSSSSSIPQPPPPAPVLQLPKMNEPLRQAHASAHQQHRRHPLHQPLPAHLLAPLSPFIAQAYQYQVLGNSAASNELQRQYLLDMIPPRSLSQQGSINWKT